LGQLRPPVVHEIGGCKLHATKAPLVRPVIRVMTDPDRWRTVLITMKDLAEELLLLRTRLRRLHLLQELVDGRILEVRFIPDPGRRGHERQHRRGMLTSPVVTKNAICLQEVLLPSRHWRALDLDIDLRWCP